MCTLFGGGGRPIPFEIVGPRRKLPQALPQPGGEGVEAARAAARPPRGAGVLPRVGRGVGEELPAGAAVAGGEERALGRGGVGGGVVVGGGDGAEEVRHLQRRHGSK